MSLLDRFITEFDVALRSLAGGAQARRAMPTAENAPTLDSAERAHAAGLMRVNHVGEVCAQALYQSQKILARSAETRAMLDHAAQEEMDHMAWCEERLSELGSHTSYLNPIWYAGSFGIGLLAGLAGDRWSLGFVAETEKQVEKHLNSHLETLPLADARSRAIVDQMRRDEIDHGQSAWDAGGKPLQQPIKNAMEAISKVMTTAAYKV
jgi:ubiquinone biosynthesis monooxygenase Coq7